MEPDDAIKTAALEALRKYPVAGQCGNTVAYIVQVLRKSPAHSTAEGWNVEAKCVDPDGRELPIKPHAVVRCNDWLVDASLPTFSRDKLNLGITYIHTRDFWNRGATAKRTFPNGCRV